MRTGLLCFSLVTLSLLGPLTGCSSDSTDGSSPGGSAGSSGSGGSSGAAGAAGGAGSGGTAGGGMAGAAGQAGGGGSAGSGQAGASGQAGQAGQAGSSGAGGGAGEAGASGQGGGAGEAGASGGGGAAGSGMAGQGGSAAIDVTPKDALVLTCSKTPYSAGGADVAWSASAGSIDEAGLFSAPNQVGPDVTITATSKSDATMKGSTTAKLATAIPQPKQIVAPTFSAYPEVYHHATASSGDRVYAVFGDKSASPVVNVLRSDDGGKTWGSPVAASPAIGADSDVSCASIAVDSGNPDIVYVVFNFAAGSGLPKTYADAGIDDERGLALAVSKDGGKTWPVFKLLQTGNSADPIPVAQGVCPDVASPKPDAVAVTTPGGDNYLKSGNTVGMYLWVDEQRGEGFTIAAKDAWNSMSSGETGALQGTGDLANVGQNGGSGEGTEAPVLFSDGKGKLCVTYVAYTPYGSGSPSSAIWLQCSDDLGKTFSAPTTVSETHAFGDVAFSHSSGVFGPNGEIVIAYDGLGAITKNNANVFSVRISKDGGKTFTDISAPVLTDPKSNLTAGAGDVRFDDDGVLWIAYHDDDGLGSGRLVVDKSCDLGATWSGPVLANPGQDGMIDGATAPSLVATKGRMSVFARASTADSLHAELRRYALTP